ncbi:PHD finger protein 11 isoform X2 [Bombina bombina]|uniref:PHD finger protein 11 isoform X2 n=1 Tax=Bombina bombina TaxID=8345 RepID=UPI00235ABB49|nr:PHD finger protein 11 isoform X2 [Bombina bombina]
MSPGKSSPSLGVCAFCHKREQTKETGSLLKTSNDKITAHANCLLFSPQVVSADPPNPNVLGGFDVKSVKKEIKRGKKLKCSYCKLKGASIGCDVRACKKTYHYLCVKKAGGEYITEDTIGIYKIFCSKHKDDNNLNNFEEEDSTVFSDYGGTDTDEDVMNTSISDSSEKSSSPKKKKKKRRHIESRRCRLVTNMKEELDVNVQDKERSNESEVSSDVKDEMINSDDNCETVRNWGATCRRRLLSSNSDTLSEDDLPSFMDLSQKGSSNANKEQSDKSNTSAEYSPVHSPDVPETNDINERKRKLSSSESSESLLSPKPKVTRVASLSKAWNEKQKKILGDTEVNTENEEISEQETETHNSPNVTTTSSTNLVDSNNVVATVAIDLSNKSNSVTLEHNYTETLQPELISNLHEKVSSVTQTLNSTDGNIKPDECSLNVNGTTGTGTVSPVSTNNKNLMTRTLIPPIKLDSMKQIFNSLTSTEKCMKKVQSHHIKKDTPATSLPSTLDEQEATTANSAGCHDAKDTSVVESISSSNAKATFITKTSNAPSNQSTAEVETTQPSNNSSIPEVKAAQPLDVPNLTDTILASSALSPNVEDSTSKQPFNPLEGFPNAREEPMENPLMPPNIKEHHIEESECLLPVHLIQISSEEDGPSQDISVRSEDQAIQDVSPTSSTTSSRVKKCLDFFNERGKSPTMSFIKDSSPVNCDQLALNTSSSQKIETFIEFKRIKNQIPQAAGCSLGPGMAKTFFKMCKEQKRLEYVLSRMKSSVELTTQRLLQGDAVDKDYEQAFELLSASRCLEEAALEEKQEIKKKIQALEKQKEKLLQMDLVLDDLLK